MKHETRVLLTCFFSRFDFPQLICPGSLFKMNELIPHPEGSKQARYDATSQGENKERAWASLAPALPALPALPCLAEAAAFISFQGTGLG